MRKAAIIGSTMVLSSCGMSEARQMPRLEGIRTERHTTTTTAPVGTPNPTTPVLPDAVVPAVGESARVGDWLIRITSVDSDGTDEVLAHNQFNEAPPDGMQFFLAALEATYLGDASASLWIDLAFTAIGPDGTRFESYDPSCGVVPADIDFAGEAFPGGTVVGATCWTVESDGAADLLMEVVDSGGGLHTRALFSLDPEAEPLAGSTRPSDLSPFGFDQVAVGEVDEVGGWDVAVVGIDDDATDVVLAENQFNDPPLEGNRYVLVELSALRTAHTAGSFTADVGAKPVGAARRVAYEGLDGSCGVIPNPISDQVETPPGSIASGALCWDVAEEDLSSLVLILTEFATGDRTHFALSRR